MGVMLHVKGIILSHMAQGNPKLKAAVADVINQLDHELEISGYQFGTDVETAIENLNNVLIELDEKEPIVDEVDDEISTSEDFSLQPIEDDDEDQTEFTRESSDEHNDA